MAAASPAGQQLPPGEGAGELWVISGYFGQGFHFSPEKLPSFPLRHLGAQPETGGSNTTQFPPGWASSTSKMGHAPDL